MAYSYNIDEVPPDELPCSSYEIRKAKEYLQKHSTESGDSLYDHLSELLSKILVERPRNAVDIFEDYSKKMKEERFKTQTDHLQDIYVPPKQYENAKILIKLFEVSHPPEEKGTEYIQDQVEDGDFRKEKPNLLDLLFYFEQADVGLPRSEMLLLNLSIRKLVSEVPIENIRFWGKILGNPKNYYVLEAEFNADEQNRRQEQIAVDDQAHKEKEDADTEEAAQISKKEVDTDMQKEATEKETLDAALRTELAGEDKSTEERLELIFPPLPENQWKPPIQIPPESIGTGLNKKVYFVCNSAGLDDWIELPMVTPQQIIASRDITRLFTGNLEEEIFTYPPFPGNEKNYLRAQIARISAATLISPMGYYTFSGGEEEEDEIEEEGAQQIPEGEISENPHFDPIPVKELVDASMSNWCHHSPFILKQGRVISWSPKSTEIAAEDEEVEEEEEEEEEEKKESLTIEREVGPPLLTPLSEDATLDSIVPWTARQSSRVQTETSIAIVRSNIWLGAFAFASGRRFTNLYIGWGNKYFAYNYSPPFMSQVLDQYKIGPEVMEITDPSFEEEEAYRIAHLPPPPKEILGEYDEQEGEMEDDEDDEDDEDND